MLSMLKPGWRSDQARYLFEWARRFLRPGMHVWDVGANQGLFSFAASNVVGKTGRVTAFEPDPILAGLMHRSAATGTHRGGSVAVLTVALSDENGVSEFAIAQTDRALNHLVSVKGNPRTGGSRFVINVLTATGDWIAQQVGPPNFIKIDVEGAECKVIEGLSSVLSSARPLLIVEVAPENSGWMSAALAAHDYCMFDASGGSDEEMAAPAWNTLAVPREVSPS